MPEIKGDYQGKLKTIKATADAKLETVTAIDAGTNVIGNIDRVATVGQTDMYIEQNGTWEPLQGEANAAYIITKAERLGTFYNLRCNQDRDLVTAPGWTGSQRVQILTDDDGRLKLATLGTVERVKEIDHLGTVGKSKTYIEQDGTWEQLEGTVHGAYTVPKAERLGVFYHLRPNRDRDLVTAPGWTGTRRVKLLTDEDWRLKLATLGTVETIKEVEHLGTIGDLTHLGSIGNVNRLNSSGTLINLPYVYDVDLFDYGVIGKKNGGVITSPGFTGLDWKPLAINTGGELETAPATSRKGGVQTVANAGTAVALIGTHTACIGVIVQADYENLGTIYVGDSTVDDTHGFKLRRDKFISFSADDVNDVYIDSSRNAQKVSFFYINY